jgi:VCBS repeat-containing protein
VLKYSDGGTLPPGLSIDPDSGLISGTLDSSASAGGPYTVVITADDQHGGTVTQTFVWVVNNPAPTGVDDAVSVLERSVLSGNVLDNDFDIDGDSISVTAVNGIMGNVGTEISLASGATLTLNADGTFNYSPNGAFNWLAEGETAIDTFEYTVSDSQGATSTATVVVTIVGENEPPEAGDDFVRTPVGEPVVIPVLTNDVDANGDPLAVIIVDPPANGTAVVNADGTITFTPAQGFYGTTTFTYLVEDPYGATSQATITVEVFLQYAWDSFNNFSNGFNQVSNNQLMSPQPYLSQTIYTLAPEPIFSGYSRPGARIIGRLYDSRGALVAESTATSDPGGNWMMHFQGASRFEHYRVEFDFVIESADVYGYLGLHPSDDSYQAMQPLTEWEEAYSIQRVMRTTPEKTLDHLHQENSRPMGMGVTH